VGVLKTLSTYLDLPFSKYDLAERSFHIARHVLNKPVGKQDEYAAAFGGLNFITFNPDGSIIVEPISLRSDFLREFQSNLMLFFTGVAHNSWELLQQQEQSTKSGITSTVDSLREIRELADHLRRALLKGDLQTFGALLHQGWEAKKRISSHISNPLIDQAYALARQSGLWAARSPEQVVVVFFCSSAKNGTRERFAMPWRDSSCANWRLGLISKGLTWWPMIRSSTATRSAARAGHCSRLCLRNLRRASFQRTVPSL